MKLKCAQDEMGFFWGRTCFGRCSTGSVAAGPTGGVAGEVVWKLQEMQNWDSVHLQAERLGSSLASTRAVSCSGKQT